MTMVYVTLHSQNFNIILLTYLLDKLLKSCFHARMIVYFSPIPWAKNKMISYHRYCRCCTSIIIFHVSIITHIRKIGNRKIRLSSHRLSNGLSRRYFVSVKSQKSVDTKTAGADVSQFSAVLFLHSSGAIHGSSCSSY